MNIEIDKGPKREIAAPRSNKMHMDLWIYPYYQTHGKNHKIVWHGFLAVWISLKEQEIFLHLLHQYLVEKEEMEADKREKLNILKLLPGMLHTKCIALMTKEGSI